MEIKCTICIKEAILTHNSIPYCVEHWKQKKEQER